MTSVPWTNDQSKLSLAQIIGPKNGAIPRLDLVGSFEWKVQSFKADDAKEFATGF
jgi:hypothetical protein